MYEQFLSSQDFQLELQQAIAALDGQMQQEYDKATDIHGSTGLLGRLCNEHFVFLDNKCSITQPIIDSQNINFETVAREIEELTQQKHRDKLANIQRVLESIRTSSGIEPETGLCIKNLLVSTWALIKHPLMYCSNVKDLVIDNLNHNIETGGGCLAGISARLTQPYSSFIKLILEEANKNYTLKTARQNSRQGSRTPTHSAYQEESLESVLARIAESEVAEATTRPAKTVVNDLATRYVPDTESLEETLARIAALEQAEAATIPSQHRAVVNNQATRYVPDTETLEETLARIAALEQPATRDVLSFSGGHSVVDQSGGGLPNSAGQDIDPETAAILQAIYGDNWRRPQF